MPASADPLFETPTAPIPTSLFGAGQPTPLVSCTPHTQLQQPSTRRALPLSTQLQATAAFYPLPDSPRSDDLHDLNIDLDAELPFCAPADDSDEMATYVEAPKFVRGHQTYGDAEFFCRKSCRLLRSGRYSSYDIKSKISQISTYCDDTTAGRIDRLLTETGVGHPNSVDWDEIPYRAGVAAGEGRIEVIEQARVPGASLQDFADWFIETFSMQDVVKAAKKRLTNTFGQTEILDTHIDQIRRDVAKVGGTLADGSQVDNILDSISPQCVDELSKLGFMGLGTLAKNHAENPLNRGLFDTGEHTITWLTNNEPAYVNAAQDAGAHQYWIGYKNRKLQTHPKRSTKESATINSVEEDARLKKLEQRQDRLELSITEVKSSQEDTKQEMTTLGNKVVSWQESSDKKQDEMLTMLRVRGNNTGKGGGGWNQNQAQATMMYGKGGGQYNKGKGGYKGKSNSWNSAERQAPAHIECWNCGKNHFAFQCKEPPNTRDPALQKRVNNVSSSLNSDYECGECTKPQLEAQFESVEQAAVWVNAVRTATVDQLVTDQHGSDEYDSGYWQAEDDKWSQQQSGWPYPQNTTQVNAVALDDGSQGNQPSQDCDSRNDPQDTTTTTDSGTSQPVHPTTRPEDDLQVGDEITSRELNMSFSTETTARLRWPVTHEQLGVPSEHALDLEMHARWGRVVAARMRRWKNRRRRRSGEKKAKARAKEALMIKANEKEKLTEFINQVADAAGAWSENAVNLRSGKEKMHLQGLPKPVVCNAYEEHELSHGNTRQVYRPRLQRPGLKETFSFMSLLFIMISIGTAFTTSVSADASLHRGMLTMAGNAAIALSLQYMMSIKQGAVMAPLLGIAWYCAYTGSIQGFNLDSLVSGVSYSAASFGGSVSYSASYAAAQASSSVIHNVIGTNLMYMSCASKPQLAHMLSLLLFSAMAIWALKWPPDKSHDMKTTEQINAVKEKQFNAAYVEIELVDEPGRLVKVLLDLGASCSVFSKRSLQGIYHKLIRHPPKAKLR